ncbi:MAG: MOSC domain-containing protein [Gammaproteobacteria bacterium]|nr:MOSC domain-containing protein [Gammaproteobacteria bacterium]MBU2479022.1 MOSC domain-containing protein [Gammaproteobacteria bacterium]
MHDRILGLFIGNIATLPSGADSAIYKHAVTQPIAVDTQGLVGDHYSDRTNHGGPDRALLHYCARHYADWQREFPQVAQHFQPPAFGENISSGTMDEDTVCIGDRFRLGTALLQVAQPRTPCWKLNDRFGIADMALRVQESVRCGWLYRVLEPGNVEPNAAIELLERPHPDMTVAALMRAIFTTQPSTDLLAAIAALEELSPNWRSKAERRLSGEYSDTSARLQGDRA